MKKKINTYIHKIYLYSYTRIRYIPKQNASDKNKRTLDPLLSKDPLQVSNGNLAYALLVH